MARKIIMKEQAGDDWKSWTWQQQNSVTDVRQLKDYFTAIEPGFFDELYSKSGGRLKFRMTPYMISQIPSNATIEGLKRHPWAMQFLPLGDIYVQGHDAYDGRDNWEDASEFPTSNLHHKYPNRVLVRLRTCFAYCNYCFESLGVLETKPSPDKLFMWDDWQNSLSYIAKTPGVEEVILSGGEPLLLSNERLRGILSDIESIRVGGKQKVRFKRIHTRALTHNPYRIDDGFVDVLK